MRPVVLAFAAFAAALAGTATPRSDAGPVQVTKAPPVLGISYRSPRDALAWFDPLTLKELRGRKAPLGGHMGSWAFSADRSVFAIGSCSDAQSREIRFVNARAMRVLGDLRLALSADCTSALAWLRPRRLLAIVQTASDVSVAVVDPAARRVLRRESLPAQPWAIGRTRDDLVVLLGSFGSFAPARVAVIDSEGMVRVAKLDRVLAGTVVDEGSGDHRSRTISPGLAVDPDGRRAFLVPASGPVAEIDLQSLAVSYHELDRPSLLGRLLRLLETDAEAKLMEGTVREARWLGDGKLALSGTDYSLTSSAQDEPINVGAPVGLKLIDTGSWSSHMLEAQASGFTVASDLVVAEGGRWDSGKERGYGPGLVAFGLDGRARWTLHRGRYCWLDVAGRVGYTYVSEGRMEVIDLAAGVVLASLARDEDRDPWPQLLAAQTSSW